ncbi:DMT family transporter [Ancylomarina sp. 16SWW S1-10-2]|uniref:DMT family transporter n=1 Tax=Ancylomarina sp. 16SWW S1-10-2 TaxID=2499681 RepID=UPI0012AE9691|nr:DMT family transporter [Ancylomarina sp. 16SWW S1-10-2]MRT91434.1 DMT family transporter [Ancylomarina sp. 16SWW S1-10-2]
MQAKYKNWTLLLLVSFIWGSPYILREIALKSFTHSQVAAFQVFLSFVLFLPLIFKNFNKLNKKNIGPLLLSGIAGNIGPSFFFAKAQTLINSSMAGMLNAMLPSITLVLAILFFKGKSNKNTILGIALGFIGALIIAFMGDSMGSTQFMGVFYVFMAILSVAISINIVSFALPKLNGIEIASLAFLFVGPMAGAFLLTTDLQSVITSENFAESAGMLALLAVLTFFGVIFYNQLIKRSSYIFAASIAYLIPIVALFWGITIGGDHITISQIVAIALILVGVNLTHR